MELPLFICSMYTYVTKLMTLSIYDAIETSTCKAIVTIHVQMYIIKLLFVHAHASSKQVL